MKQTEYFKRRVLVQRPYIKLEWCEEAIRNPEFVETQPDGRIRHWLYVEELGKYLLVIILDDGKRFTTPFLIGALSPSSHAIRIFP